MKQVCPEILELLDSHVSGELPPADASRVEAHVKACPECARELAEASKVKAALALALREETSVSALRERVLGAIDASETTLPRASGWARLAPVAAGLVAGAALTFALTPNAQAPDVPQVDTAVYSDSFLSHAACAVMRTAPSPPTLEQALSNLGFYRPVLEAISEDFESGELVDAHVCPGRSRRYGHVVLRVRGELVSLLVTEKSRGVLPPGDAATRAGGVDVHNVVFPIFALAGFESERFLGFVVTPRPELDAEEVARELVPNAARALAALDDTNDGSR